ncbi:MAG TPA: GPR1/FUN34/YaaH family transporter, partial [Ktedonobacteraceae bacterium]|nr:GPR1/FUN34/YaaH family transporter [Ktedonobacteraceae bacterium]
MIMTVLTFLYVLASLRTNITLVITFFFIDMAFFMLMSSYWTAAEGRDSVAQGLQIVSTKP